MNTTFSKQSNKLLFQYRKNVLIQLIAAIAIGFILAYAMYIIVLVLSPEQKILISGKLQTVRFDNAIMPHIGMQSFVVFLQKPWIVLTYAWAHPNFWSLLSNMLWLYCFGSVIQSLIGFKEIVPFFIFSYIFSGLASLGVTAMWPVYFEGSNVVGALPATVAFGIGAIALAPTFKFYFAENFGIPLWALLALFVLLNVTTFSTGQANLLMVLCISAAIFGFVYINLIKRGAKPGVWLHNIGVKLQNWITPAEFAGNKHQQKRIDTINKIKQQMPHSEVVSVDIILDKINQKGYNSLTQEEKDILLKASEEN